MRARGGVQGREGVIEVVVVVGARVFPVQRDRISSGAQQQRRRWLWVTCG
jgi:hypothetical protein